MTEIKREIDVVRNELDRMQDQFALVLPKQIPKERFSRVALTAIQNNPSLLKADRRSLWNSFMRCAQDGLLPDGNEAVILAFKTKVKRNGQEVYENIATYIPCVAGVRKKARNSGLIEDWYCEVVHEKDHFDFHMGDEPRIIHKPSLDADRGKIIAVYSIAFIRGGGISRDVMSVHDVERIRKFSRSPDGPAWKNHYAEMCKKTVARRHRKILPASTDLDDLFRRDDVVHGDAQIAVRPERPALQDFTGLSGNEPEADTGTQSDIAHETVVEPGESFTIKTETDGETIQKQTLEPGGKAAPEEPSAADAFERGRRDHDLKRIYPPVEYRDVPALRDAWQTGYNRRKEEKALEQ